MSAAYPHTDGSHRVRLVPDGADAYRVLLDDQEAGRVRREATARMRWRSIPAGWASGVGSHRSRSEAVGEVVRVALAREVQS